MFFYHLNPSNGIGIFGGKWLCKNTELFAKEGISFKYNLLEEWHEPVDYSILHTEEELKFMNEYNNSKKIKKVRMRVVHSFKKIQLKNIKNIVKHVMRFEKNKKRIDEYYRSMG